MTVGLVGEKSDWNKDTTKGQIFLTNLVSGGTVTEATDCTTHTQNHFQDALAKDQVFPLKISELRLNYLLLIITIIRNSLDNKITDWTIEVVVVLLRPDSPKGQEGRIPKSHRTDKRIVNEVFVFRVDLWKEL